MKSKPRILVGLAGVAVLVVYYVYGGSTVPEGQPALVRLNSSNVASLEEEFNKSSNSIRLLVMLSPT
jgi:hypothetical protein